MAEPMDVDFVLKLCHAFSYALSRSLTETMGEAQGVLFKRYVDSLIPLLRSAGVEFQNLTPEGFCKLLRERGSWRVQNWFLSYRVKRLSLLKAVFRPHGFINPWVWRDIRVIYALYLWWRWLLWHSIGDIRRGKTHSNTSASLRD